MAGSEVASWPKGIGAITLFVEDLAAAKQFYAEAARELIEPGAVAPREAGSRLQFTIEVDDVDAMCAEMAKRGVELLNGPMDRPWGIRTASFTDPGGHIWEIAK